MSGDRDAVPVRLMIVDDHAIVRSGLEQLFATLDDVEVVATAGSGRDAIAFAGELRPDVVLMDLAMPEMDGVEATTQVLTRSPESHVVAFTSFSDRERILEALDAGAIGYLLKDAEPAEVHSAILAAARGESPLTPKVARAVVAARTERTPSPSLLTDREREVLVLLASGLSNKQIGHRLGISEKTVKTHLTNIFQRIGARDRTQAALWAERHGVLRPDEG
jgi:DNA-binding NarL/FixJ family response regulator